MGNVVSYAHVADRFGGVPSWPAKEPVEETNTSATTEPGMSPTASYGVLT